MSDPRDPIAEPPPSTVPVASPPPVIVSGRAVVTEFHALEEETWELPPRPNFFQRWRRGWRLMLVICLLAAAYGKWRGGRDYFRFKEWRARGLAAEAIAASAGGSPVKAAALLDQAAILAPLEPTVMRTMADFCEPRQDIMAIYALRQVVKSGEAEPADLERLCRLALDWGHPELAASDTLKAWAAAPTESLSTTQLRLSAVWFASMGNYEEGEKRLRLALAASAGTPEAAGLEVALARLLMNAATSAGTAEAANAEPLRLLSGIAYSPTASLEVRAEATRLLAGLLLHPARREMLTPVRAELLRTAFLDLAHLTEKTDAAAAHGFRQAATTVDLTAHPERRPDIIDGFVAKASQDPVDLRLMAARWLSENGAPREALTLCDSAGEQATGPAWFTVRMDALFALKEYAAATRFLENPTQPLPPHQQQLFLYRLDLAAGRDEAALALRRKELEKMASRTEPKDILSTAENLEKSGDTETALALYTSLKGHPHAGLTARLGMVRCLDADPARTSDLIKALESVIQLWPQSDQARSDLAYLRLLDEKPAPDDDAVVADLHRESPWYLAFRITAALAQLQQQKPAASLALLESGTIPWDRVRAGWQAVYANILNANGKKAEAQAIASRLKHAPLRPGEEKLLAAVTDQEP